MTLDTWNREAETNIRLLPKYGYTPKTEQQKQMDSEFVDNALQQNPDRRKASEQSVYSGFQYLQQDIKTAMYRFNQAYLLDSTNTDIYWGFGSIYMMLGDYPKAESQYKEGLAINPFNTNLLTDYGTLFMVQYHNLLPTDIITALLHLERATTCLLKSYKLDPKNQNTTFKLSVCYWNKGDCNNAWKYYDICKKLGGQPITPDYTKALTKVCNRKN